jgi:hypothetical protein
MILGTSTVRFEDNKMIAVEGKDAAINPLAEKVWQKFRRERFAWLRLVPFQNRTWGDETKGEDRCSLLMNRN